MPSKTGYTVYDDRFVRISKDEKGNETIIAEDVDQAEAARRLISLWLAGNIESTDTQQKMSDQDFAEQVLRTALIQIVGQKITLDQQTEILRHVYGNNPRIVALFARYVDKDWATQLWGIEVITDSSKNETPPNQPVPQPADSMPPAEQAQGKGALAPQKRPGADVGAQTGKTTGASLDGQTIGAPDGSPQGKGAADAPIDNKNGGDPLVLATGCFYYQATDFQAASCGPAFTFTRTYLHQTRYNGPLGFCWDHSYNLWVREAREIQPDGSVRNVVYRSNGALREDTYVQILSEPAGELPPLGEFPDATFIPPAGAFERLEKAGERYTLEIASGVRIEYGDNHYASRIVDPNGNTMSFEYDEFLLRVVTDPLGRKFTFSYDPMNRLRVLRDETGGREVHYSYTDNADLFEVDLALGGGFVSSVDYRYLGADFPVDLQHNLTQIINADGEVAVENEYGTDPGLPEFNKVVRQRSDDGEFEYEYDLVYDSTEDPVADPVNAPVRLARVIYPNKHAIEHWISAHGYIVRRIERVLTGGGTFDRIEGRYRFNPDGMLVEEVRAGGERLEYLYGREAWEALYGGADEAPAKERLSFCNLLRVVVHPRPGFVETRRIVTRLVYHERQAVGGSSRIASRRGPFYADPLLTELRGQAVQEQFWDYDERGNLVRTRSSPLTLPNGTRLSPAPAEYFYNALGLPIEIRRGNERIAFEYFDDPGRAGFVRRQIVDPDGVRFVQEFEVDALGRATKTVDSHGAVTETEYTAFDAVARVKLPTSADGNPSPAVTYEYDKARRLRRVETEIYNDDGTPHPDGPLVRTDHYDNFDRLVEQRAGSSANPTQRVVQRVYNPAGLIARTVDPLGNITRYEYDERMLVRSVIHGVGAAEESTHRYRYDRAGEMSASVNARGFATTFERDAFGRVSRQRFPDGEEIDKEFDAAGRLTRVRLLGPSRGGSDVIRWGESEARYDEVGNIIERIAHVFVPEEQDGTSDTLARVQYFRDEQGRVVRVIGPQGEEERSEFDRNGRVVRQFDGDGNIIEFAYNDAARTVTIVRMDVGQDEAGRHVQQAFHSILRFDQRELLESVTGPLGTETRFAYDSRGLQTKRISGGSEARTEYDLFGQPVRAHTAGAQTEVRYDASGNLIEYTTPSGGRTVYRSDGLNRLTRIERDDGSSVYLAYDASGAVAEKRDANGVLTRYIRSAGGKLLRVEVDSAGSPVAPVPPTEFMYCPLGRVSAASGALLCRTRMDSLGRPVEETDGAHTMRYEWGLSGRLQSFRYPGGRLIEMSYSPAGALKRLRQLASGSDYPGDPAAPAERDLVRVSRVGVRPLSYTFGSSHIARMTFGANARVAGTDWAFLSGGEALLSERDLFDASDRLAVQQLGGQTRLFQYDAFDHVVSALDIEGQPLANLTQIEARAAPIANLSALVEAELGILRAVASAASPARRFDYTLDGGGNRLASSSQVGSSPPILREFAPDRYDRYLTIDGRPVLYDRADSLLSDGVRRFHYDGFGRLVAIYDSSGAVAIEYDALGRRSRVTTPTSANEFVYAGARMIEWRQNGVIRGQVVPLERPNQIAHLAAGGREYWPVFDLMDSPVAWIDGTGAVVGRRIYDPFGVVISSAGEWPAPFGFAGYFEDGVSPLCHLAARSYHPELGRFLQPDPLGFGDGPNVYHYAHHMPGTLTDHFGLRGTGVDNWLSKTWWAKAIAPFAFEFDKGVTFGAKVAGHLALTATFVVGGAMTFAWAGLAGAAIALGIGLSFTHYIYSEEVIKAAGAGKYNGHSVGWATLGSLIGYKGIYETIYGTGYFDDHTLTPDERAASVAEGIAGLTLAVSTLAGGAAALYRWRNTRAFLKAVGNVDTLVIAGKDPETNRSMANAVSKYFDPDRPGKLDILLMDENGNIQGSLAKAKNVLVISHADWAPKLGLSGAPGLTPGFYDSAGQLIDVTFSPKVVGAEFLAKGFQGGTIILAACRTGQFSSILQGTMGGALAEFLGDAGLRVNVYAPTLRARVTLEGPVALTDEEFFDLETLTNKPHPLPLGKYYVRF